MKHRRIEVDAAVPLPWDPRFLVIHDDETVVLWLIESETGLSKTVILSKHIGWLRLTWYSLNERHIKPVLEPNFDKSPTVKTMLTHSTRCISCSSMVANERVKVRGKIGLQHHHKEAPRFSVLEAALR